MSAQTESEKKLAALEAVKYIRDGMTIGLGTGSTAFYAVGAIGDLVKQGMQIKAVPTSVQTKQLARSLHIPLVEINEVNEIDITIDGADEFTTNFELIKGGGGALLREKVVASLTKENITIADSSKHVQKLGKFKLPVEVIPFAMNYVISQLRGVGGEGVIRKKDNNIYMTDSKNYIIDVDFGLIGNPAKLANELDHITGIVEHGLFINRTNRIIMAEEKTIHQFQNHKPG
ncbi:MAG: ribose 5-phosphate isomerase A [Sphingobacteriales bacterium 41-5]|nr:MAG: ribose 5-phosphate isomerase A [Niabella sp. SCN 42-15]OJU25525.1 MAG: ribose 5-phosphate isomerase A [Sphingobacteriales bacterium 41-5]